MLAYASVPAPRQELLAAFGSGQAAGHPSMRAPPPAAEVLSGSGQERLQYPYRFAFRTDGRVKQIMILISIHVK